MTIGEAQILNTKRDVPEGRTRTPFQCFIIMKNRDSDEICAINAREMVLVTLY